MLFDNINDPYQMVNLADNAGQLDVINKFRALLDKKMTEIKDDFRPSTWYRDNWISDRMVVESATMDRL